MNLEVAQAEREYDLNRAAELKYGTSLELNKQLKVGRDGDGVTQCTKPEGACACLAHIWDVHTDSVLYWAAFSVAHARNIAHMSGGECWHSALEPRPLTLPTERQGPLQEFIPAHGWCVLRCALAHRSSGFVWGLFSHALRSSCFGWGLCLHVL